MTVRFVALTEAGLRQIVADSGEPFAGAYAMQNAAIGLALTAPKHWADMMLVDGLPALAMGIWPLWPGRAEGWVVAAADLSRWHLSGAMLHLGKRLEQLQAEEPAMLRRVEMWVRATEPWRISFAEHLGMVQEGLATAWGPDGSDHALYARVAGPSA